MHETLSYNSINFYPFHLYLYLYILYCFLPKGAFQEKWVNLNLTETWSTLGTLRGANGEEVVKNFCKIAVF